MIRRLVLDIMKPHEPDVVVTTQRLSEIEGIEGVTMKLVEMDEQVVETRVAIEGKDLDLEMIQDVVEDLGGSIHSVDEVSCGQKIIEDPWIDN